VWARWEDERGPGGREPARARCAHPALSSHSSDRTAWPAAGRARPAGWRLAPGGGVGETTATQASPLSLARPSRPQVRQCGRGRPGEYLISLPRVYRADARGRRRRGRRRRGRAVALSPCPCGTRCAPSRTPDRAPARYRADIATAQWGAGSARAAGCSFPARKVPLPPHSLFPSRQAATMRVLASLLLLATLAAAAPDKKAGNTLYTMMAKTAAYDPKAPGGKLTLSGLSPAVLTLVTVREGGVSWRGVAWRGVAWGWRGARGGRLRRPTIPSTPIGRRRPAHGPHRGRRLFRHQKARPGL
jgi:hypothetical protein